MRAVSQGKIGCEPILTGGLKRQVGGVELSRGDTTRPVLPCFVVVAGLALSTAVKRIWVPRVPNIRFRGRRADLISGVF